LFLSQLKYGDGAKFEFIPGKYNEIRTYN